MQILLIVALVLLIPLLAMQFSEEVNWSPTDFAVAGALLFSGGIAYELIVKRVEDKTQRVVVAAALLLALLLVWVELAVGVFGTPWAGS